MGVLCIANFPADTGYAWKTIERYFEVLGTLGAKKGFHAYICYPENNTSVKLNNFEILVFDYNGKGLFHILRFAKILRKKQIKILYFVDQPTYSLKYFIFRLAGVKRIIIHDHTSGERTKPSGLKYLLKKLIHRIPPISGDLYIGVSGFVVKRLKEINLIPPENIKLVYNGVDTVEFSPEENTYLHRIHGIDKDRKIIFFSGRIISYKGVYVLIDVAEEIILKKKRKEAVFICCGDGPDLEVCKNRIEKKNLQDHFFFLGKREDVNVLLRSATIAIVPSLWQEAFSLTVIEAMASGIPVIASKVGGIPEIIEDGRSGILVEPGNVRAFTDAIERLLSDDSMRREIGQYGREQVLKYFDLKNTLAKLEAIFIEKIFNFVK